MPGLLENVLGEPPTKEGDIVPVWRNIKLLRDNGGNTEILGKELGYGWKQILMDVEMASEFGRVLAKYHSV
jgi:hypothetical protein